MTTIIIRENDDLSKLLSYFIVDHECFLDHRHLKRTAEFLSFFRECDLLSKEHCRMLRNAFGFLNGRILNLVRAYPHLYRLFLAIGHDLEILTGSMDSLDDAFRFVVQADLHTKEISDLGQLEATHLLSSRGYAAGFPPAFYERCRRYLDPSRYEYIDRTAAYLFTHVVFYLTDFGRRSLDNELENALLSCNNIGAYAYINDDLDLLSEVCLCLHFLQAAIPETWVTYIQSQQAHFSMGTGTAQTDPDNMDYHRFIVSNWALRKISSNYQVKIGHSAEVTCLHYDYKEHNEFLQMSNISFQILSMASILHSDARRKMIGILNSPSFPKIRESLRTHPNPQWVAGLVTAGLVVEFPISASPHCDLG